MKHRYKVLGALAIFGLVGGYVLRDGDSFERRSVASRILGKADGIGSNLPDSAREWRGRVDYPMLDRQLTDLAARPDMAGLAVAVVEKGKLTFVGTYGVADKSTQMPVTTDTVFRWASVSKTVTGTLAAALASDSSLDLQRPLSSWQTSLRLPGGAESRVTLAQLLAHQTGLTKNAYDEKLEANENPRLLRSILTSAPLQCDPGTCHTYQNIAFDAATEILTQAADQPFTDEVSERFFLPLGMKSASFGMTGLTAAKDWARPHSGSQVRPLRESYWHVPAAAGVESNIVDFARWLQAAMGGRPEVVPPETLRMAQESRVNTARPYGGNLRQAISDAGYGLGWRSFTYEGQQLIGHSGAVDGYRATMAFDPETRTGIVAMWNSNAGKPFRIPFLVLDSYHKRPDADWLELRDEPSGERS